MRSHDLNRLLDKPGRRGCGTPCKYLFGDHRSESQAVASVIFTRDAARRYCNACVLIGASLTFSPARRGGFLGFLAEPIPRQTSACFAIGAYGWLTASQPRSRFHPAFVPGLLGPCAFAQFASPRHSTDTARAGELSSRFVVAWVSASTLTAAMQLAVCCWGAESQSCALASSLWAEHAARAATKRWRR